MPTPYERYQRGAQRALQELQTRWGVGQQQWQRGMQEKRLGLEEERLDLTEAWQKFQMEKPEETPSWLQREQHDFQGFTDYYRGKNPNATMIEIQKAWREREYGAKPPTPTQPTADQARIKMMMNQGMTREQAEAEVLSKWRHGIEKEDDYQNDSVFKMMYEGIATAKRADKKRTTRGPLTPQEIQAAMQEAYRQYRELQESLPNPEFDELFKK